MPTLRGHIVRRRAAQLGLDMCALADAVGVPHGTLCNATRPDSPDPMHLIRIWRLVDALNANRALPRLSIAEVVADDQR